MTTDELIDAILSNNLEFFVGTAGRVLLSTPPFEAYVWAKDADTTIHGMGNTFREALHDAYDRWRHVAGGE